MKDLSFNDNSINSEAIKQFLEFQKGTINFESFIHSLKSNISFKSSFTNLQMIRAVEISIINSKIKIKEFNKKSKFQKSEIYSKIKEINKKYKNFPLNNIKNIISFGTTPHPLYLPISQLDFNSNHKIIPFSYKFIDNYNKKFLNEEKNIFPFKNFFISSLFTNINESRNKNNFLNLKREKPFLEPKKNSKKYKVLISARKEEINSENSEDNSIKKKIIFRLDKKNKNSKKIQKKPGRKKKNSGEIGTHNKFSKDNMMRKLKNKVMESARKLINKMIRKEAGERFKEFGEIRKIEGVFCQELNIKFNFWFYVQRLKSIFQFKMSSKYSKGDLNSNSHLISKIYLEKNQKLFPKTIRLLDTMFHQYYHDIFLGEKKWILDYDLTEDENIYELNYFLNNNINLDEDEDNEEEKKYTKLMKELAEKYELFFLKKNPRIYSDKKGEKDSQVKQIIKNISPEELEKYRYYFILKGTNYSKDLKNTYSNYLNQLNYFSFDNFTSILNNDINLKKKKNDNNNEKFYLNEIKNNIVIKDNITNNDEVEKNQINLIKDYENNAKTQLKSNLFDIEKADDSRKPKIIKKVDFNIIKNFGPKDINNSLTQTPKGKCDEETYNSSKILFNVNKNCGKSKQKIFQTNLIKNNSFSNFEIRL